MIFLGIEIAALGALHLWMVISVLRRFDELLKYVKADIVLHKPQKLEAPKPVQSGGGVLNHWPLAAPEVINPGRQHLKRVKVEYVGNSN